ncbi:hypothetical protein BV898_18685 [Hypsibius exemplaris]|uniref:LRAT domain-containing protein n=1 Tax=Hypsibius exemplaris TaxID=2072580 RepID=A0A9X6RNS2_HYPEX|nr:hypothetical protein BV898_18685 [Hypsibius exemplaris]
MSKSTEEDRRETRWISEQEWQDQKCHYQIGDLIEFASREKLYRHWGMFLGGNLVVHVTAHTLWNPVRDFFGRDDTILDMASQTEFEEEHENHSPPEQTEWMGMVIWESPRSLGRHGTDRTTYFIKVEHIVRIVQKGTFRVNNNGQNTASLKAKSADEIFRQIQSVRNQKVEYCIRTKNCEHFVTSWKYHNADDVKSGVNADNGTSGQVNLAYKIGGVVAVALGGLALRYFNKTDPEEKQKEKRKTFERGFSSQ